VQFLSRRHLDRDIAYVAVGDWRSIVICGPELRTSVVPRRRLQRRGLEIAPRSPRGPFPPRIDNRAEE
jgi:hypothetical protein